jgi:hypothetical protein
MFSNIRIARYDENGAILRYTGVPVKLGPKEKAFYWLKEKRKTEEVLPIIAVDLYSIDFATERMGNMKEQITITKDTDAGTIVRVYNCVPYNIGVNVNIWTLFMVDLDQILEQILPYFTPHSFIRLKIPELNDLELEIKVIITSCNPDLNMEYGEEDWRILRWTLNFTVQAFMFKKADTGTSGDGGGLVKKIIENVYTSEEIFNERDSTTLFTSAAVSGADYTEYLEGVTEESETAAMIYKYEIYD